MAIDYAGAAVGTAFGELFGLVKEVVKTIAAFRGQVKKIEVTLDNINPIINDIGELNKQLDRRPEDMGPIKNLLDKGKELVNGCSRIHPLNLCKKYTHSNKLTEFDEAVRREFDIYMSLIAAKNTAEILVQVEGMRKELRLSRSGQPSVARALGALGNLAVPEPPDFIVGSEVEASLKKLKGQLLQEGVSVIVVTAPGGCGKTTLLMKLCHDVDIEGKFKDNIMFVRVSKKPNLPDIVQKMIQHMGFSVPMIETEDVAVQYLQQLLTEIGQNPVLLVLDDVWTEWEKILEKFVFKHIKDYKIVVTSRYDFPRYSPVHRLNPLTHCEALELFRRAVTVDDTSVDAPDDALLDAIVKRCKGLPLALTVIAKSLQGKDRSFWQKKLLEWSEGQLRLDSDIDILECLKKSLDELDGDPSRKERFMDLGSFPEGRKIPATALIDMWVELYRLDFEGVRAITELHELVSRNLATLLVTRKDSSDDDDKSYSSHYAMQHDLLRELAIKECNRGEVDKRERLILDLTGDSFPDWWSEQKKRPLNARLVSISTDRTFSAPWPNLVMPAAEALVLNFQTNTQTKTYVLPEFIGKSHKLKALIVTNYSFFPAELGNFHVIGSNLKRIRLERVMVPFLSLGNLSLNSLQKLSLFMCDISQASTSNGPTISNAMPNLLELEIDYCNDLATLPDDICEINCLRKLSITNCHNFSALPEQIGQSASIKVVRLNSCTNLLRLPNSIGSLKKLVSLNISDCMSLSILPDEIGQLTNLERMNMRGCLSLFELPRSIVKLRNLRKVVCDKGKDNMWGPLKKSLNSLKIMVSEEKEDNLDWLRD